MRTLAFIVVPLIAFFTHADPNPDGPSLIAGDDTTIVKPAAGGPAPFAHGRKFSLQNSFTGTPCFLTSHCDALFSPQPLLPKDMVCCKACATPDKTAIWTVERKRGAVYLKSGRDYLCAIRDTNQGLWQGNNDPSLAAGFYIVTKRRPDKECLFVPQMMENGEVSLKSSCGRYIGINTAGYVGMQGEIPMCAVWENVCNSGHTYKVQEVGGY